MAIEPLRLSSRQRNALLPYLFVAPGLIYYLAFTVGPVFVTIVFSFFKWRFFLPTTEFAGLSNFEYVLKDHLYWKSLSNNLAFLGMAVVIPVSIGLILAVLIRDLPKGRTTFRALLFLPCIFSGVVISFTWKWIYHPFVGLLNGVLKAIGLSALQQSWLGDPRIALLSVFVAYAWASFGFSMVIYLAGLQNMGEECYEAADLEGATFFQRLFKITIPMLRETTTFVISLRILTSMGIFDIVYNLTGGGPFYGTYVISIYTYEMLNTMQMSWGSAAATTNSLLITIMYVGFMRFRERKSWD